MADGKKTRFISTGGWHPFSKGVKLTWRARTAFIRHPLRMSALHGRRLVKAQKATGARRFRKRY